MTQRQSLLSVLRGFYERRPVRIAVLTLYYALIIAGLILIYGRGDFSTPAFVYQGF